MTFLTPYKNTQKAWRTLGLLVLSGSVLGGLILCGPVYAQSERDMNSRMNRIENEIKTLSRAIFRGEEPPPGAFSGGGDPAAQANLEIRVQQLESELQTLRGLIEQQGFEVRQVKNELERVTGDMELRLQDLEGGATRSDVSGGGRNMNITTQGGNNPPQPSSSGAAGGYQWNSNNSGSNQPGQLGSYNQSPASGAVSGRADDAASMYENAFSLVKNNQYDAAETGFKAFLDQYPDHVLSSNAKYWLGETYYVRGNYQDAARLFAEGYQQAPKGNKAADNLLKLGMSLSSMGKKEDACIAFSQINKEGFANAGPVMRRADQEKTRLGCSS